MMRQRRSDAARSADRRSLGRAPSPLWWHRPLFLFLVLGTAVALTVVFSEMILDGARNAPVISLLSITVFFILAFHLAQSIWTSGIGVLIQALAPRHPRQVRHSPPLADGERVALVMPIFNEAPARVFAGLRSMWEELVERGVVSRFDAFVLSDTTDSAIRRAETAAWQSLRRLAPHGERIRYRCRQRNIGRKSGNIEDFLQCWGDRYGYMVVLDADSLLTGATVEALVDRMDRNPFAGLVQVPPKLVRGRTLFARFLQFASELQLPLAASGTAFWTVGEGNYWGHNAIVRVRPFMEHCKLPVLPGGPPLGGHLLSHDFVEAAFLRRAGWQVLIASDLSGSYEEAPPTLVDFLVRERRWCKGNLQYVAIVFLPGLHWVSRLHLGLAVLRFLVSPLWLLLLILLAVQASAAPRPSPDAGAGDGWLFITTALTLLLGPIAISRTMSLVSVLLDRDRRCRLGGAPRVLAGAALEASFAMLSAPVKVLFHTVFVATILSGTTIDWRPQRRTRGTDRLFTAAGWFLWPCLLGTAAAAVASLLRPDMALWLVPVVEGFGFAVLAAMITSSERLGDFLSGLGLLLSAEDTHPPPLLRRLERHMVATDQRLDGSAREPAGSRLRPRIGRHPEWASTTRSRARRRTDLTAISGMRVTLAAARTASEREIDDT